MSMPPENGTRLPAVSVVIAAIAPAPARVP
jgi:hypothetical protein